MTTEKEIPRWQQGLRPWAHGETWDSMTPRERRRAFIGDIIVCLLGILLLIWLFGGFYDH